MLQNLRNPNKFCKMLKMNLNISKSVQSLQTLPNPKNIKCYQMLKKTNETNPNPWTSTQCVEIYKIKVNDIKSLKSY